ncbi:thermonuclease family protein [Belnapia rosea]|uniref:thermonuclease family protein n=1 Tax=Belnapia rosea TaxID=938405 RepID=UPI000882AFBB|nr:thermonuclease family protein [Belnapia rosea]SDB21784.1 micrococcal nuclease [Belnapia rosea]
MIPLRSLLVVLVMHASPCSALAEELRGRVVGIADGDTLTLLTDAQTAIRVRLSEIDTPERRQPYGSRAREALSNLAYGRHARVDVVDEDRYGRTVGRVRIGATDVNAEMVRRGAAWVYRRYSRDPALLWIEAEARAARRGLWALPEAQRVPPWEWRTAGRH